MMNRVMTVTLVAQIRMMESILTTPTKQVNSMSSTRLPCRATADLGAVHENPEKQKAGPGAKDTNRLWIRNVKTQQPRLELTVVAEREHFHAEAILTERDNADELLVGMG